MDERFSTDRNHYPVVGGIATDTEEVRMLRLVEQDGLLLVPVANYVYHVGDTEWQKGQQSLLDVTGDLTVTMGDVEKLLAKDYWKNVQYDYDGSGNMIYLGRNINLTAANDDTDWYIIKYGWDGNGDLIQTRTRTTSWTNRTIGW